MGAIFGYGSLILPMSALGRFEPELKEKVKQISEDGGSSKDYLEYYLKEEAVKKWKDSEVNFIPVKIYGLERYYSLEIYEEGNMLVAQEDDQESFINGVIISPLKDEQIEMISETESEYKLLEKNREDIESYIPEEKLQSEGLQLPETVLVYVGREGVDEINMETERKKLESYHKYPIKGIELLAERWYENQDKQQELVEEFMKDFRASTFEIDDNGVWKKLSEK